MRELEIRFKEDGPYLSEIDENRKYFLSEAEEIVQMVRKRLVKEKRDIESKGFLLVVEGKDVLHSFVQFHRTNESSLFQQIIQTIETYEAWEDDLRQYYINRVKEYAELEKRAFVYTEFRTFTIRLDELLQGTFSIDQYKKLFDCVYVSTNSGFYSKLEVLLAIIQESFHNTMRFIAKDSIQWFEKEEQFHAFCQFVSASYLSVSQSRLPSIQVQFDLFHKFQDYLFTIKVKNIGFQSAGDINDELQNRFLEVWNSILLKGFPLQNEDMVKSLILAPVIQEYFLKELALESLSNEEKVFLENNVLVKLEGKYERK